jgi:glutathione-regulated potassium-efflux system ancillary protein KefG
MPKVLVLLAHPVLERSRLNRRLADAVRGVPGLTVHDLYEHYPDFAIDVRAEQRQLTEHDVLVMQHPFYWYSSPALLKEWQDLVLEHGWAYGRNGKALEGKTFLSAVTTGGPPEAYTATGSNRFTMRQLLVPFEQMARLCGMRALAPFVIHGALRLKTDAEFAAHSTSYRTLLVALRDGCLDLEAAGAAQNLADDVGALVHRAGATR